MLSRDAGNPSTERLETFSTDFIFLTLRVDLNLSCSRVFLFQRVHFDGGDVLKVCELFDAYIYVIMHVDIYTYMYI